MKISNMLSHQGNPVPNQFIVSNENATFFQSYKSVICKIEKGKVFLDERYYKYSKTAIKYRNLFLSEDSKTIEKKIKLGEYALVNLN